MFTVLSNTRNSNSYLIAALAVMAVALFAFAVVPAISAPKSVMLPVTGTSVVASDYYQRHPELKIGGGAAVEMRSDFFQRHPEWISSVQVVGIPVTGMFEASDYFQRHPVLSLPVAASLDTADYFTRHPELRIPAQNTELSDYFLRH
jgi:hypothetical protein